MSPDVLATPKGGRGILNQIRLVPPTKPRPPLYFLREPEGLCVVPHHPTHKTGYSMIRMHGKQQYAHRVEFESRYGPIPVGMLLLNLCGNRACLNVDQHWMLTTRSKVTARHYEGLRRGNN